MRWFLKFDRLFVRWFNISLVNLLYTRKLGVPAVPTFLLTTTGWRSGRPVEIPIFYYRVGDAFVVIASKGGAPEHPVWFRNLEADPHAMVRIRGRRIPVSARVAEGEERENLWRIAARAYPPYDDYQAKAAERRIPVVVLEPEAAPAA